MIFFDTSALVKAYVKEPGTESVRAILNRRAARLAASDHVALETLASFAYMRRDQRITPSQYRAARREFFVHYPDRFLVAPVDPEVVHTAMRLAHEHRKLGVGSVDLLHVATVIHLRAAAAPPSLTVVCADRSMRLLAAAAGFAVFDPERDDPARLERGTASDLN